MESQAGLKGSIIVMGFEWLVLLLVDVEVVDNGVNRASARVCCQRVSSLL